MQRTAAVLGASGFAGGELLRLLASHRGIEVAAASGDSRTGESLAAVHPHLASSGGVLTTAEEARSVPSDVCFSCLPSGELAKHIDEVAAPVVIDLAADFRSDDSWAYGLTELNRAGVAGARRIANPGCYPTAALLALVPFAGTALVADPVVVDAISGTSGAGRKLEDRLMASTVSASVSAYGSTDHAHVFEIERGLSTFGDLDARVSFTPHLAPMSRGLLATVRARLSGPLSTAEAAVVLRAAYEYEPFVEVLNEWPSTKAVCGSNGVHVAARADERSGWLVCSAAIDNLGKGAAGQALQNANLVLGFDEGEGLETVGVWP